MWISERRAAANSARRRRDVPTPAMATCALSHNVPGPYKATEHAEDAMQVRPGMYSAQYYAACGTDDNKWGFVCIIGILVEYTNRGI